MGIYVGRSPFHAGNVALVLNPKTGHVSPQYHVVFDDDFTTVPYLRSGHIPANWSELVASSVEKVTDEAYNLASTWTTTPMELSQDPSLSVSEGADLTTDDNTRARGRNNKSSLNLDNATRTSLRGRNSMPPIVNLESSGLRRSSRPSKAPDKMNLFTKYCLLTSSALMRFQVQHPTCFISRVMNHLEKVNLNFDGSPNLFHPFAFAAFLADNEVYTFREVSKQPDFSNFVKAMEEIGR